MRISTAIMTGLVFSATTSVAWSIGAAQPNPEELVLPLAAPEAPVQTETTSDTQPATTDPTATESSAATTPEPTATIEPAPNQTKPGAAQPSASQTPTATPSATPLVVTKDSDVIDYKYGVVQISMTQIDGKITDVKLLQGDASYGRDAAYTALINATIQVQGTSYGNVSGATFTTDAFKKAVDNVMAKF